jgi:hypothetical protein
MNVVQIWARNQGGHHTPPDELIMDNEDTWGVGNNVQTLLYNKDGEVRGNGHLNLPNHYDYRNVRHTSNAAANRPPNRRRRNRVLLFI